MNTLKRTREEYLAEMKRAAEEREWRLLCQAEEKRYREGKRIHEWMESRKKAHAALTWVRE